MTSGRTEEFYEGDRDDGAVDGRHRRDDAGGAGTTVEPSWVGEGWTAAGLVLTSAGRDIARRRRPGRHAGCR